MSGFIFVELIRSDGILLAEFRRSTDIHLEYMIGRGIEARRGCPGVRNRIEGVEVVRSNSRSLVIYEFYRFNVQFGFRNMLHGQCARRIAHDFDIVHRSRDGMGRTYGVRLHLYNLGVRVLQGILRIHVHQF